MTFIELFIQGMRERTTKTVLKEIHPGFVRDVSGAYFLKMAGSVQAALEKHGVHKGDRVVLLAPNSARWIAIDVGILSFGAICVPLYHRQEVSELAFMIQDCEPALVICWDEAVRTDLKTRLIQGYKIVTYEEVFQESRLIRVSHVLPSDCVTFCYTSGTSGKPKGAMISRENMEYMLRQTKERVTETLGKVRNERVFHFLPFCFMGSRVMLHTQLLRAKPVWLSMDLNRLKDEMPICDPHYYLNVPAVLERIKVGVEAVMTHKSERIQSLYVAAKKYFEGAPMTFRERIYGLLGKLIVFRSIKRQIGKHLKFLICGSAPLAPSTQKWFQMLGIPVLQVYGLTETTAIITMDRLGEAEVGFVGKPIPGCEVKLTDDQELVCKGPNVFMGYWRRQENTKEILKDGWLHTGDQAEINAQGQYRILGRIKNILVSESGHNIVPEPLEEQLKDLCPAIEHVVVVGHARPFLTAIVTGSVTETEIDKAIVKLNEKLPHYRKIKSFYISKESLSIDKGHLTANQKLRRQAIERYFEDTIASMYQGQGKAL
ncbi:MAG: AMP-binding protein [Bdellovibrionales bacterium]|nr:AMP-binding protein [Bdellovibrionales bacterium]